MKKNVDYIIVGQGLAGTVLSHILCSQGHSVMVIDDRHHKSSSMLAAGTFNPAVFRRLGLIWKANELMDFSIPYYLDLEQELKVKLVQKMDLLKVLSDEKEHKNWLNLSHQANFEKYFKTVQSSELFSGLEKGEFGLGTLSESGTVNLGNLLRSFRKKLIEENSLLEEKFVFEKLTEEGNAMCYGAIKAEKIIFCEGHQAIHNPYFSWLPFNLTKGEILHVNASAVSREYIFHKRINLIPQDSGDFWAGATFEWQFSDDLPSVKGKLELTNRVEGLIGNRFEITKHEAGVRPTVADRRPLLGVHPKKNNVFIFNGLGTRGVLLAPYFARQMVNYLNKKEILDSEVDISRYASAYKG